MGPPWSKWLLCQHLRGAASRDIAGFETTNTSLGVASQHVVPHEATDRRAITERRMASMVIVEVNVAVNTFLAMGGAVVREAVDALAKQRLDEPFGFAVRTRPIGSRTSASDS